MALVEAEDSEALFEYFGVFTLVALDSRHQTYVEKDRRIEMLEKELKALQKQALQIERAIVFAREAENA